MAQSAWIRKLGWTLGVAVAVCIAAYVAWNIAYPSGSWRYKLTVAVETPEGIKTGSAVREVFANTAPAGLPEGSTIRQHVKGEAVVVDLGAHGQAYALLPTYQHGIDGAYYIVSDAFKRRDLDVYQQVRYYKSLKAKAELEPTQYPVFVYFRDPADPKTVENLLEMKRCPDQKASDRRLCIVNDGFAEAFGEGVKLKSVTIEMTREPVTRGVVEGYLSWLPEYRNKMFDGRRYNILGSEHPFANSLAAGAFKSGDYQ